MRSLLGLPGVPNIFPQHQRPKQIPILIPILSPGSPSLGGCCTLHTLGFSVFEVALVHTGQNQASASPLREMEG